MAVKPVNVFGDPVSDETVRSHFRDKEVITRKDRAYLAYNVKEADKKKEKAEKHVQKLKGNYGDEIATLITIYNATGDTLTLFKDHDFSGHIREAPYPNTIQNGQWAAFLQVAGSSAAVLYRGRNYNESGGEEVVWLNAWWNIPNKDSKYVYTEIRKPDHYNYSDIWDRVYELINKEHSKGTTNVRYSTAFISRDNPYIYSGIMTLECVP